MYRRVEHVQFGIMGPDEIRAMSVAHITEHERYEKADIPKENGLMDLRMGTIDTTLKCKTCDGTMTDCPGHFGHIELAHAVFNVMFMGQLLKVLRMVCIFCSRILVQPDDSKYEKTVKLQNVKHRFKQMYALCTGMNRKTCVHCGMSRCNISRDKMKIVAEYSDDDRKQNLTPDHCNNILRAMSDDDIRAIGMDPIWCRPEYMILTVLPVSPPAMRPTVTINQRSHGEDDITHKLVDIIRANNRLRAKERGGCQSYVIAEAWDQLQYHTATMMQNPIPGYPAAVVRVGSREIMALERRLKTKEGRIRGNLMGKRVDFSARSVITPDPNLAIDELGVPLQIAMNMTYPEIATPHNIGYLYDLVRTGPYKHPGARYIVKTTGQRIDLRYAKRPELQIGYTVERHLVDGDLVIFNRQPSLHKMSMMGHRVRVMSHKTFRLNLSVTTPYNADFDGDEMNMHVPQSAEARAEISELMMVPSQIISPQANKPVIGLVQDALLGANLMTKRDTFIPKDMLMNILMWIPDFDYSRLPVPAVLKPHELWTGKQVFGILLPKNINITLNSNMHDDETSGPMSDTKVIIQNGEIISGQLDKKSLGTSQGSLVHVITNENGRDAISNFLSVSQQVVNYWLLHNGFSVGVSDIFGDDATMDYVRQTINDAKSTVDKMIHDGVKRKPGMNQLESLESNINAVLDKARDDAGLKAARSLQRTNRLSMMVNAGSKGSSINIAQIVALVGQQNINGKRIPFLFNGRTLPHFTRFNMSPGSRGFVENSFKSGLTPTEFFHHAMCGREGLIDTAVKTAETGYIQRRLMKAMETIMVEYDGTVRNSLGHVLQFQYGEDGLDGTKIEGQFLETIDKDREHLIRMYAWNENDPDADPEFTQVYADHEWLKKSIIPRGERRWPLPVNLRRLLETAQIKRSDDNEGFTRQYIIERNESFIRAVVKNNELFRAHLRSFLASKRIIWEYELTRVGYEWLLNSIERMYIRSFVNPGEMVGPLAAQSIGEPATQMTLNTFHFTGIASKNVTLGVPRLIELINVASKNKTPSLTVHLEDNNLNSARSLQKRLQYCNLRTIVKSTAVFYDPNNDVVPEDHTLVSIWNTLDNDDDDTATMSPWVMRVQLDSEAMLESGVDIDRIIQCLSYYFQDIIYFIYGDDNDVDPILRLRHIGDHDDGTYLRRIEPILLNSIMVNGVKGITKVFIRESDDEWVLDTDGINLRDVLGIPGVDSKRTISNNVTEVIETLGIEAARNVLLSELKNVLSFDGSYVNHRHLAVLVDTMTHSGHLMSITRHGINQTEIGTLTRCSFEETTVILTDSAAFGSKDKLTGVSGNIILGQLAKMGTACFDMFLDERMLKTIEARPEVTMADAAAIVTTTTLQQQTSSYAAAASRTLAIPTQQQPMPGYEIERMTYYDESDESEPFEYEPMAYQPPMPDYY